MVIQLCYTSAFKEVIYADFYAKILDWSFRLVDENSRILVVVFVSKLNFSFSFHFIDENCQIFVVVVFVTKINLFSSTKIFVFVVVDEKKHLLKKLWIDFHECRVGLCIYCGWRKDEARLLVEVSALTLLVGWQEGHPAHEKPVPLTQEVLFWNK